MGFIDLKKVNDRVNREAIWQLPRMYHVVGKQLNVNSLAYARVKEDKVNVSRLVTL